MEETSEKTSASATKPKTFMFKCPCKEKKCHLGVFIIIPKESEALSELSKVQKKFYLGHGIKTNDPIEAAKILLHRDHKKFLSNSSNNERGKSNNNEKDFIIINLTKGKKI